MDNNDGPAVSAERLELAYHGDYVTQGLAVRRRDFCAADIAKPFQLKLTWDQLDDGLYGGRHATVRQTRCRRATGRRIAAATSNFRFEELLDQITAEDYAALPEEFCKTIEAVDGRLVKCESPSRVHNRVALNLA